MKPAHRSHPTPLIDPNGALTPPTQAVLALVSGVAPSLLQAVRVRPASSNWLRAPWYRYARGGAMTIGRTIWFTACWWHDPGLADRSVQSTNRWLMHLAHEVGHLPQAERFGYSFLGRARYVTCFAYQYGMRALAFKRDVHDGAPLEIEADIGRWVLAHLLGPAPDTSALIHALQHGDASAVAEWCTVHRTQAEALRSHYRALAAGRSKLAAGSP